ncbi:MAG TPA: M24 family metallopeptidase [Chloroflexota bacterium]|jgi:Xaa-Pro aminopeptidase
MAQATRPLGFSVQERDRRWQRLRELMARQQVDVLLVFPRWMPGDALFVANRLGTVIFPQDGEPSFVNPRPGGRATTDAWIADQRVATTSGTTAVPFGGSAAKVLRERGLDRGRIAVAGLRGGPYTLVRQPEGYVNYSSLRDVQEALPQAELVDGTPILTEARYVKSEEEIAVLRRSVEIAEASAAALVEYARPGVPAAEVYAQMMAAQWRHGVDNAHVAWVGGPWGARKGRSVASPPGVLENGWIINNEIEPSVQGYTCQVDAPVCVGPAPDEAQEMFVLGQQAFLRACQRMRPGTPWSEVIQATEAVGAGGKCRVEFLVHGRGLGDEGPMFIPTDEHPRNPLWNDPIRANTVFILKPYAYRAGEPRENFSYETNVTWGDSVVVREHGAERLGTRPHALIATGA